MDLRPQRLLATIALAIACSAAFAQDRFPAKPIQFIVPLPSGATVDVLARWWAERLASRMQHPVVVQNRPGAAAYSDALAKLILWCQSKQTDPKSGIWMDTVSAEGAPKATGLAHNWKANYHDVRGLMIFCDAYGPVGRK